MKVGSLGIDSIYTRNAFFNLRDERLDTMNMRKERKEVENTRVYQQDASS